MLPILRLKKNEEHRLLTGHLWVYSNEIDVAQTPLIQFTPGQQVVIETAKGKPLGVAYVNPHSLICARLISRDPNRILNKALLVERIKDAFALRSQLYSKPFYRLIFGESDYLPGLVVDRYGDTLVAQITTAGMEFVKNEIAESLIEVISPQHILLRNDLAVREIEKISTVDENLLGTPPEQINIIENDLPFLVNIKHGQKTGWFYDHRDNRARLKNYVANKRVLDLFCYSGAWSIPAACWGANEVVSVDSSAQAINWLKENAELNNVSHKIKPIQKDAFDLLNEFKAQNEKFDVIVLDPPAFIKRRKDVPEGSNAYRRLNQLAMRLLNPNGIIFSASCSLHLERDKLFDIIRAASPLRDHAVQIIEQGHQGKDHPIHPAILETDYLKLFVVRCV